jgi:outer membrane cobalamin receptor
MGVQSGFWRARRKVFRRKGLLIGAISLMALGAATAATAQSAPKAADLDEVLVTGKYLEESLPLELAEYGNRVQLIQSEAIEKRAINDVAQALQIMAPSLYIQPKAGAFDYVDISMEGSRTSEVLWLVDGVRITNRLYNGTTPLDTIPAAMVERIEVLEGGQGLFYGTQSVAGVVNVITKSLSKTTGGHFSAGVDSNDGRHISGFVRGAAGPHEFVVYASSDQAKGFQPLRTADYQPSATDRKRGYDVQTIGVKYGVDLGEQLRLSLGYQRTHAKLDFAQPTLISLYYNERDEDIVNGKLDWNVNDSLSFFLKAYYHLWDSHITRYNNSITSPGTVIQVNNNTFWGYKDYGLNALAKFAPGHGMEFYAGYDFQNYNGRDDVLLIAQQTEKVHAVFGQVRTTEDLFGNLKLAAGLRRNMPKSGKALTIWNVSGQYDLNQNLFLRATAGTAYRLPDANELYANDPCCEQGNSSLQGEKSTNLNASVGGVFDLGGKSASWELVGFARKVENLIGGVDNGHGVLVFQNTAASTEVKGWLATANLPLGDNFSANLSYSATDATNKATGLQIDRVPKTTAKGGLEFHPADLPVGASVNFNYFGTIYQTLSGGLGRRSYGGVTTADLSGYYEFGPEQRHRLTARVQNLADKVYTTRLLRGVPDKGGPSYLAHYEGVPRTFSLQYSYEF